MDNIDPSLPLKNVRAIGLLNNWEVFGHERGCIEWFEAIRRQGASVTVGVTTMLSGGALKQLLVDLGFPTFDLPYGCQWSKRFFKKEPSLVLSNLKAIARCSKLLSAKIRETNATHVLIGNSLVFSFVAPALWMRRGTKLIYRMGDEPSHDSKPNLWIWKRCFARASVVVSNSEFVKRSIEKCSGQNEKIRLIYNVAPAANRLALEDSVSAVNRLSKCVLFVGQIASHKGADLLVDAAIQICKNDHEFRFHLLGSSLYTKDFEDLLKKRVTEANLIDRILFHGQVSDPTEFYCRSSVLVVPSVFEEPAANVVLEAKRLGLPAIVFPSGGLPELVQQDRTGIVCKSRTIETLHSEIVALCGEPERLGQMQLRCVEEYQQRFSQARFDQQWRQVFVSTLIAEKVRIP